MKESPKTCLNQSCQDLFFTGHSIKVYCSEKCKEKAKEFRRNDRWKNLVFKLLGSKCIHCGFEDYKSLKIERTGDTLKDLTESSNRRTYHSRLCSYLTSNPGQEKYQLICSNCHLTK